MKRRSIIGLVAGALLLVTALPGFANHSGLVGSNFEIEDGNLKVDGSAGHLDWNNVAEAGGADTDSGQNDDSFTQGTDEQEPDPVVATGSIPPSKSDLKNFGIYAENGTPGFLHMFWTRVQEPNGTTNMDFEFNQNDCQTTPAECSANGVTPIRMAGDMLITYNLSSGGTNVSLWLHRWITGSGTCEDSQEGGSGDGPPPAEGCWDVGVNLSASGDAEGSINTTALLAADTGGLGSLSARTFGEASIDLSEVFGTSCFAIGSVYLKSRSSDTFTSAEKDFIAPTPVNISNCGSLKIVKKDDAGNFLGGVKFKLYKDDGDGTAELGTADVQIQANGTAGSFECVTTSANGTGDCSWSNLFFGSYWVQETFLPTGYTLVGANPRLVAVSTTTQVVVNITNNRQPATLKVKKVDDLGNPLAGAVFTLYTDASPTGPPDGAGGTNQDAKGSEDTATSFSCTTVTDGTCTITGILPVGKFWVVETTTPTGYTTAADQWVQLALGENKDITSTPFTNPRQHKIIVLVCHEATNTLAASDVTIGTGTGSAKTSLATGATLPDGVSEAELCGLGGASYGGIDNHPTKTATIDVGSDAHP